MNVRQFPLLHCLSVNNNLFHVNHYVIIISEGSSTTKKYCLQSHLTWE